MRARTISSDESLNGEKTPAFFFKISWHAFILFVSAVLPAFVKIRAAAT
jgi:hypothetical protein